jgi:PTH1 family peptidyl-tRNA hydrolase
MARCRAADSFFVHAYIIVAAYISRRSLGAIDSFSHSVSYPFDKANLYTSFRNLVSSIMGKAAQLKRRRGFSQSDTDSDAFKIGAGIDNDEITTSPTAAVTRSRSTRKLAVPNPRVEESAGRKEKEREAVKAKGDETSSTPAPAITIPQNLPPPPMSAARALPLLICSIGNPGKQYANTLHSAGHLVVKKLQERLHFTPWEKSKRHGNGLISSPMTAADNSGSDWTLWQSTSLMNVSGKGVKGAHDNWAREKFAAGESEAKEGGKLVIVHDELEKPLGEVTLNVRQGASAKGHNGLKSILMSLRETPFVRIGVGIGRPVSRDRNDVADYVMRKMKPEEQAKIEGSVDKVIAKLRELERVAG